MRTYLSTIHTRSDSHKKRFALLTSFSITLVIFSIWSLVKFSPFSSDSTVIATDSTLDTEENTQNTANAIAPLDSLTSGIGESYTALKNQFNSVKGSVKTVNLNSEYEKMRNDALNNPVNTQ